MALAKSKSSKRTVLSNDKTLSPIQSKTEVQPNQGNSECSQFERVSDSLFDSLPDEIYLKIMTTYDLSVNEILEYYYWWQLQKNATLNVRVEILISN